MVLVEDRNGAFGNEVAQTDDSVIVEATRTSALPHSKQTSTSLFYEEEGLPRRMPLLPFRWKDAPGLFWGPRFESKQTKCAVWDAMCGSVVQQMVIKITN